MGKVYNWCIVFDDGHNLTVTGGTIEDVYYHPRVDGDEHITAIIRQEVVDA